MEFVVKKNYESWDLFLTFVNKLNYSGDDQFTAIINGVTDSYTVEELLKSTSFEVLDDPHCINDGATQLEIMGSHIAGFVSRGHREYEICKGDEALADFVKGNARCVAEYLFTDREDDKIFIVASIHSV